MERPVINRWTKVWTQVPEACSSSSCEDYGVFLLLHPNEWIPPGVSGSPAELSPSTLSPVNHNMGKKQMEICMNWHFHYLYSPLDSFLSFCGFLNVRKLNYTTKTIYIPCVCVGGGGLNSGNNQNGKTMHHNIKQIISWGVFLDPILVRTLTISLSLLFRISTH